MKRYRIGLATLAATLLASAPASAQTVSMHGQVRPRFEFRDPSGGGSTTLRRCGCGSGSTPRSRKGCPF